MARKDRNAWTSAGGVAIAIAVVLVIRNVSSVLNTPGWERDVVGVFFDTRFENMPQIIGILLVWGPFLLLPVGIVLLLIGRSRDKTAAAAADQPQHLSPQGWAPQGQPQPYPPQPYAAPQQPYAAPQPYAPQQPYAGPQPYAPQPAPAYGAPAPAGYPPAPQPAASSSQPVAPPSLAQRLAGQPDQVPPGPGTPTAGA